MAEPSLGWALSSWSHLGLSGAISLKEQVMLVATVIEIDPAQLCIPDKLFFLPAQPADSMPLKLSGYMLTHMGQYQRQGGPGALVVPWDLTSFPAKT